MYLVTTTKKLKMKMTNIKTKRKFEPWYLLATPFKMYKDCGPDGLISEFAKSIIINPISNIGIIRKNVNFLDILTKNQLPENSIRDLKDVVNLYYLDTLGKNKEFKRIKEKDISDEYSLYEPNSSHYDFPVPFLLAIFSPKKLIELRESYSSQNCLESSYSTVDKEAVSFMKSFTNNYQNWFKKWRNK